MSARRAPNNATCRSAHHCPLAKIKLIRLERQAAVARQEPDKGLLLLRREHLDIDRTRHRHWNNLHLPTSSTRPRELRSRIIEKDARPTNDRSQYRQSGQSVRFAIASARLSTGEIARLRRGDR